MAVHSTLRSGVWLRDARCIWLANELHAMDIEDGGYEAMGTIS